MGSTTGSIIITVKGKEVYVGTAPPSSPVDNELWLDISENNVLKYYKASTKTWCIVNDVSEKFGDVYKYLQTNYYTKTETNNAVKEEIGKTTIIKKDGTVVNMKDAINSVIDTATEHTQKIEDINSKYNSVTGEITEVKTSTSEIKQDLNGFKTTVSSTYVDKTEFNNLQIGGTNLIRRDYYLSSNSGLTIKYGENGWIDITGTYTGTTKTISIGDVRNIAVTPNEYVLSVERASEANVEVNLSVYSNGSWKRNVTIPTSESSVVITIAENETLGFLSISAINGTTYALKYRFKLEKGNKATDWSPAPEDIENQITSVKTSVEQTDKYIEANVVKNDEVVSKINASTEGVTIKADKLNLEGYTTINDNFKIDERGNMEATGGKIADFNITENGFSRELDWVDQWGDNAATITGSYKAWCEISPNGSGQINIGAGVGTFSYQCPTIRVGYYDRSQDGKTVTKITSFETDMMGISTNYFKADKIISDLIPVQASDAVPTPSGYRESFPSLGSSQQTWQNLYVKSIYVKAGIGDVGDETTGNIEASGKITAQGDVIAGLGTDNQVSLQGLKDTTTQIRGKSIFSINNYGTGASKTGSSVSLWTGSATLTHGFYIAIISAVISTNKNTSRIELLANGNTLMAARTNSTTYERVFAVHNFGVSGEQSFNFELSAKSQDASTTVTVPGYRTYSVLIFKIG